MVRLFCKLFGRHAVRVKSHSERVVEDVKCLESFEVIRNVCTRLTVLQLLIAGEFVLETGQHPNYPGPRVPQHTSPWQKAGRLPDQHLTSEHDYGNAGIGTR